MIMNKFTPGTTYTTRCIGDANCIINITVARRTAKTVITNEGERFRVFIYRDVERFMPWGRYSMAPVISADRSAPLNGE